MDFLSNILEKNNISKKSINGLSPLVYAYLGDSIFDIFIRTYLVGQGGVKVNQLHKSSISYVKAKAQAESLKRISDILTDEESDIVRRGRNIKPASPPKNADIMDYRYATGFEALIGYLYMIGEHERLLELLNHIIKKENV